MNKEKDNDLLVIKKAKWLANYGEYKSLSEEVPIFFGGQDAEPVSGNLYESA